MPHIHHLALRVADCAVSADFYVSAFGLIEAKRVEDATGLRAVWLRAGGVVLMLERSIRGVGEASGSGHVLVFTVPSLDEARARLERARIPIVDRTDATLYVTDPDGHRVGVSVYRFGQDAETP